MRTNWTRTRGWIFVVVGLVIGLVGVVKAWDARLHNAIVSNTVENPWPGYLLVVASLAVIVTGVVWILGARNSPTPGGTSDR